MTDTTMLPAELEAYEMFTMSTARYPGAGQRRADAIGYCALGLGGETGELAEKIAHLRNNSSVRHDAVRDEFGDGAYYLCRFGAESGFAFKVIAAGAAMPRGDPHIDLSLDWRLALEYCGKVGRVLEHVKKAARDGGRGIGGLSPEVMQARASFQADLTAAANAFADLCVVCGYTFREVLEANVVKLTSRRERGVLHGEGDQR